MSITTTSLPESKRQGNRYATARPLPDFIADKLRAGRETDLADAIAHVLAGNRQMLYDLATKVDGAASEKARLHLKRGDYRLWFCPATGKPEGVIKCGSEVPCLVGAFTPVGMLAGEGPTESVCFCEYADFIYRLNGALMWAGFEYRVSCKHPTIFQRLLKDWEKGAAS